MHRHPLTYLSLCLATTLAASDAEKPAKTFAEAFTSGTWSVDARLRHERKDPDAASGRTEADLTSLRVAPGFTTRPWHGLQARIEGQLVAPLGDRNYSYPGRQRGSTADIKDVEAYDVREAWVRWSPPVLSGLTIGAGREALSFDDHRFVSSQPWQQKEQSLDGASLRFARGGFHADYRYVARQDSILNQLHQLDAHLINAGYRPYPWLSATTYLYDLRYRDDEIAATTTVGARVAGQADAWESFGPVYTFEGARQFDGRGETTTVSRSYVLGQAGIGFRRWNSLVIGIARIGEDDGVGLRTPLSYSNIVDTGYRDTYVKASLWGLIPTIGMEAQAHQYMDLDLGEAFANEFKLDAVHSLSWIAPLNGTTIGGQFKHITTPEESRFIAETSVQLFVGYRQQW